MSASIVLLGATFPRLILVRRTHLLNCIDANFRLETRLNDYR